LSFATFTVRIASPSLMAIIAMSGADCKQHGFTDSPDSPGSLHILGFLRTLVATGWPEPEVPVSGRVQGPIGSEVVINGCISQLNQERKMAPRARFELATLRLTAEQLIQSELAVLVLIEGIQQAAMKRDESLSPSLFTFRSHLAAIHRD
jgi:hypothetical protein